MLQELNDAITPLQARPRSEEPARPYKEVITSDVYFTNEKWQECLRTHGILVDAETRTLTIQSASVPADLQYDLTGEELTALTDNSVKEVPVAKRLEIINGIIQTDYNGAVTTEHLNSDKRLDIALHPSVEEDLHQKLDRQQQYFRTEGEEIRIEKEQDLRNNLPKGGVVMDGGDLAYINANKGWFREGRHGREVTVDEIRVEPTESKGTYKMTAIIDGETVSHEITQKQYDKFMAIDDYHRMKLFSKVFGEVDMKSRDRTPLGAKIGAALLAGAVVASELGRGYHNHPRPEVFMDCPGMMPRAYFKPGVDTPMDVAARNFEAAINTEHIQEDIRRGI